MSNQGLRERKKQETRVALRTAALRLAAERGLDGFTVEDLAAAADVSPRTFFNYFPSKEAAVVGLEPGGMDQVVALLAARPADEEPLLSLHAVLREVAGQIEHDRELHELRTKVIAANPSLLPRHVASFVEFERVLVEAIQQRRPVPNAALLVACTVAALRVSADAWVAGDALLPLIDEAFRQLAVGLVSAPTPEPPTRPARRRARNLS